MKIDRQKLQLARGRTRLTQVQLAERAGLSDVTVAKLEHGGLQNPRPTTVVRLADALGIEPEEILAEEEELATA